MAKPNHIPKFGNWDPNDQMLYTVVFDAARGAKGGKIVNPNDPMENESLFGKGSDLGSVNHSDSASRPTARHPTRASGDDSEFGSGNQGFNASHGQHSSRGEEDSFSQFGNGSGTSIGSGLSPIHPQAYGRLGRKPGSASPAFDKKSDAGAPGTPSRIGAPGTPSRIGPERYAAPLPKFGDWDVNNPSAGEGYTQIFDKARDEKKTGGALRIQGSPLRQDPVASKTQPVNHESTCWFCRCFQPTTAA